MLDVPSILVSLVIFVHFVSSRAVRATAHQHSVFLLLLVNFFQISVNIPITMSAYQSSGIIRPATAAFCTWWTFYDYSLYTINADLMAWMSIERHLLIFHAGLLGGAGSWKRWSLHVAPWLVCLCWGPFFYMITIVSNLICTNTWTFDEPFCGQLCFPATTWGLVDIFLHMIFIISIILTANIALIIRVVYQQISLVGRTRLNWRSQRKMVLQLSAISSTYLVVWLPVAIIQLVEMYLDPTFLSVQLGTLYFLAYVGPLTMPFVYFVSIPHLLKRLKRLYSRKRRLTIAPVEATLRERQV